MSSDSTETVDFWQQKCYELEKIIKTLSTYCVKVVEKHEELLANYKKNQEQYKNLVQKLKDKGEQIKKAKDVLEPITIEYQAMKDKYEMAVQCQYEAENFATQINKKNKILTRQSQMLLSKVGEMKVVDVNFEDDVIDGNSDEAEYYKGLDQKIKELGQEKSALNAQVKSLHEDCQTEKERKNQLKERLEACRTELTQAKSTIATQESTLQQLAKTSEAACKEYEVLQRQFDQEYKERTLVEATAHNYYVEKTVAQRQSAMLITNIGDNNKLLHALIEVENVTTTMETMRVELEHKIKTLQEELKAQRENSGVEALESEIGNLIEERDSLLQRLSEAETASQELRSQYSLLTRQYDDLEKKYDNIAHAPPPLPPPPPPPPPLISKTGGFLAKITGGKRKKIQQQLALGGAELNKDYSKAVEEMMKRIKQGYPLKPVLKNRTTDDADDIVNGDGDESKHLQKIFVKSCPDDEDGKAMKELQNILNKMKKARSEEDLTAIEGPAVDENSEFARTFKKFKQASQDKKNDNRPRPAPRNKLSSIKDEQEQ